MSKIDSKDSWRGANNVADPNALPPPTRYERAEAVVEALNVDITPSGTFKRRAGYSRVETGHTSKRYFRLGDSFVYYAVDAEQEPLEHKFYRINTNGWLVSEIRMEASFEDEYSFTDIAAAVEHNGELFGFLENGVRFRTDGNVIRSWGVPGLRIAELVITPRDTAIPPGVYKVAVTRVNAYGEEGAPFAVQTIASDQAFELFIRPSATHFPQGTDTYRIYMSADSGTTMYMQTEKPYFAQSFGSANGHKLTTFSTKGMEMVTEFMREPPVGSAVESHEGSLLITDGNVVWITSPLRPHQIDLTTGYVQYPAPVTNVLSMGNGSGVYISADKCYFVSGIETENPQQDEVFDVPAVRGSAKRVSADKAMFVTEFGTAMAQGAKAEFVHREKYAMPLFKDADVGIMKKTGLELAVIMPKGVLRKNRLQYDV